jgi:hypothetical protein
MSATELSILVLIIGGTISIGYNLYQWWTAKDLKKLTQKKDLASIADSQGAEANSMLGLAKLVMGFLDDFRQDIKGKFEDMEKKIDHTSQQLADHAAKDDANMEEIKNEIAKIAHA